MCRYLFENGKCELRIADSQGRRNIEVSIEIREAFYKAAEKSPHFSDAKLGVACGAQLCCFAGGKFAGFSDCPYYNPS